MTTVYIAHKLDEFTIPEVSNITSPTDTSINKDEIKEVLPQVEKMTVNNNISEPTTDKSISEDKVKNVEILSTDTDYNICYVRHMSKTQEFDDFVKLMNEYYTEHHKDADLYVETLDYNHIYAVLDSIGNWCRVILKV